MGLDTVELIMKIENHFGIHIPDEEAEGLVTVGLISEAVARHVAATPDQLSSILLQVRTIIADHAGLDLEEVQPEKSITSDLGLD